MQDTTNLATSDDDHAETASPQQASPQQASPQQASPQQLAAMLMDVAPLVMRTIRTRMRSERGADLTVPQFRVLGLLRRRPGSSLSDVAEHVGLTASAASRLVDGLVARGYVRREHRATDRRAVALALSPKGVDLLEATYRGTQAHLAERVAALDAAQRVAILTALENLGRLFQTERRASATRGPRTSASHDANRDANPDAPDEETTRT